MVRMFFRLLWSIPFLRGWLMRRAARQITATMMKMADALRAMGAAAEESALAIHGIVAEIERYETERLRSFTLRQRLHYYTLRQNGGYMLDALCEVAAHPMRQFDPARLPR